MNIFFQKPKRVVYFCQYYNEKGLKVDFVSSPAWQWILLADLFWTKESVHMKSTIHLCDIFRQVIFVNIRFFVNFVNSVYQYYFFYVISLWFIGDEQRSQKGKWEEGCVCFINQVRAGWFFGFFFVKETFWLNIKNISYISSFHPWTPRSSLQFSLLSTAQFL